MKRVDVIIPGWKRFVYQLKAEFIRRRDPGTAIFAGVEESLPVDLSCRRVVDDETSLHPLVVGSEPRVDPERSKPYPIFLVITHTAGDIHHVNEYRIRITLDGRLPGAVPLVLLERPYARVCRLVGARDQLPPEGLAEGTLEVPKRLRSPDCDAGVFLLLGDNVLLTLWFNAGQGKVFAEHFYQFFEADLHLEYVLTRFASGLPLTVSIRVDGHRLSRVAVTLAYASAVLTETKPRYFQLRQRDRHNMFSLLAY